MQFDQLKLIDPIKKALNELGYTKPTPIQEKAIPLVLNRNDILGSAQTGTGKTAAFAIPVLQLLTKDRTDHNKRPLKALIVTPTRELAIQIDESFTNYGKFLDLKNAVIFGGVKPHKQVKRLKAGVDILVATPGRLLDLESQGLLSLSQISYFVLDEADRMLDMGFIHDIKRIISKLPQKRQSLFFSATMPKNIVELSNKILTNPRKISVDPTSSAADTVQQFVYYTNKSHKKDLLHHILEDESLDQVLVFSRTKHGADRIVRNLKKKKIESAAIHGDKAQNQRQKALLRFKNGQIRVLVATDIAARGIDINQLRYVINYDVPNVPETYVHRIGRSGRAGKDGVAISISEPEENAYIKSIEKLIKKKLQFVKEHPYPQTDRPMNAAEKAEFEKEKVRRKQEFFANRAKNRNRKGGSSNKKRNSGRRRKR